MVSANRSKELQNVLPNGNPFAFHIAYNFCQGDIVRPEVPLATPFTPAHLNIRTRPIRTICTKHTCTFAACSAFSAYCSLPLLLWAGDRGIPPHLNITPIVVNVTKSTCRNCNNGNLSNVFRYPSAFYWQIRQQNPVLPLSKLQPKESFMAVFTPQNNLMSPTTSPTPTTFATRGILYGLTANH